jgi:hypothetical protein
MCSITVTEGGLHDWLGGGNSRHTKEIRKRVVGAMAASRRMLQRQRLQAGGFPASKDP